MARPLRIEYEDAWYHVMHRGAGRRAIFHNDQHRELFFKLLDQTHFKYKIEIHAYCLMSNHYHLLIRTPMANLNQAMRNLNGIYALRYNRDRQTDGPLFRGRYKAIIIEKENYLLSLSRYIHLNPVEACICQNPEDYKWSSYSFYINNIENKPRWLFTDETLSQFGESNPKQKYRQFVDKGADEKIKDFYQKLRIIPVLGTDEFVENITNKNLKNTRKNKEIPDLQMIKKIVAPSVKDIILITAQYYNCDILTLKNSCSGRINPPRSMAIYLAASMCQQTFTNIAMEFGNISPGGISSISKKMSISIQEDLSLKKIADALIGKLNI